MTDGLAGLSRLPWAMLHRSPFPDTANPFNFHGYSRNINAGKSKMTATLLDGNALASRKLRCRFQDRAPKRWPRAAIAPASR
jgi:hypothetical protein